MMPAFQTRSRRCWFAGVLVKTEMEVSRGSLDLARERTNDLRYPLSRPMRISRLLDFVLMRHMMRTLSRLVHSLCAQEMGSNRDGYSVSSYLSWNGVALCGHRLQSSEDCARSLIQGDVKCCWNAVMSASRLSKKQVDRSGTMRMCWYAAVILGGNLKGFAQCSASFQRKR
jgi:hypothetical protein